MDKRVTFGQLLDLFTDAGRADYTIKLVDGDDTCVRDWQSFKNWGVYDKRIVRHFDIAFRYGIIVELEPKKGR